jgi:uncharacterized protein (DUF1501 family)
LPKELSSIKALYDAKKVAILANVGVLEAPTTKSQASSGTAKLPPQLRSHSDQANFWQIGIPSYTTTTGWGGRIADILAEGSTQDRTSFCVTVAGINLWQSGEKIVQYPISSQFGPESINALGDQLYNPTFQKILNSARTNIFEREIVDLYKRSIATSTKVESAYNSFEFVSQMFNKPRPIEVPGYMSWAYDGVNGQLGGVARMIAARKQLGAKRQVFFVGVGGFDNHDSLGNHPPLLKGLDAAFKNFYDALVSLGVVDNVITFTASDFGRTLLTNQGGSDHGWGGHHFIMGGAVKGGDIYGSFPQVVRDGIDYLDTQGNAIPTTSVDQYAATLARWMGVSDSSMSDVLPNIGRFSPRYLVNCEKAQII